MLINIECCRVGIDDQFEEVVRLGGFVQHAEELRVGAELDQLVADSDRLAEAYRGERTPTGLPALHRRAVDAQVRRETLLARRDGLADEFEHVSGDGAASGRWPSLWWHLHPRCVLTVGYSAAILLFVESRFGVNSYSQ